MKFTCTACVHPSTTGWTWVSCGCSVRSGEEHKVRQRIPSSLPYESGVYNIVCRRVLYNRPRKPQHRPSLQSLLHRHSYVRATSLSHTHMGIHGTEGPPRPYCTGWMARGTGHGQLRHLGTANVVRTSRRRALLHCLPRLVRYLYCTVLYCSNCTCSFWIAVLCVIVFRSRPSGDVQCVNTRCGNGTESWRARSALAEYSNV